MYLIDSSAFTRNVSHSNKRPALLIRAAKPSSKKISQSWIFDGANKLVLHRTDCSERLNQVHGTEVIYVLDGIVEN